MHTYRFSGFTVFSEIQLPIGIGISSLDPPPDIVLSVSKQEEHLIDALVEGHGLSDFRVISRMRYSNELLTTTYRNNHSVYLIWNKLRLGFRISSDTKWVEVFGVTSQNVDFVSWIFLSQVFGFILHSNGFLCLHAGVVERDNQAIGLLGANSRGKSTLTASLVRSGWSLVSDDILCIDVGRIRARSLYPFIKLRRDSIDFLGLNSVPRTPIHNTDKMKVELDNVWGRFTETTGVDLRAIYLVRRVDEDEPESSSVKIESRNAHYSKACLASNGFAVGFLSAGNRRDFVRRAGRLTDVIPVRYLTYPSGLEHLQQVNAALSDEMLS